MPEPQTPAAPKRPIRKPVQSSGCEQVDEASRESFPASDPPSWGPSIRIGKPKAQRPKP